MKNRFAEVWGFQGMVEKVESLNWKTASQKNAALEKPPTSEISPELNQPGVTLFFIIIIRVASGFIQLTEFLLLGEPVFDETGLINLYVKEK